jgi:hypothetical protein
MTDADDYQKLGITLAGLGGRQAIAAQNMSAAMKVMSTMQMQPEAMKMLAGISAQQAFFSKTVGDVMKIAGTTRLSTETAKMLARLSKTQHFPLTEAVMKTAGASRLSTETAKMLAGLGAQNSLLTEAVRDVTNTVGAMRLSSETARMLAGLGAQQAKFSQVIVAAGARQSVAAQLAPLLAANSAAWFNAASVNVNALRDLSTRVQLSAMPTAIMQPLRAYNDFSTKALRRLAELDPETIAAKSLARSIDWAQVEITEATARVPALVDLVCEEDTHDESLGHGRLNLLVVERRELAAMAGGAGVLDIADIRAGLRAARVSGKSLRIQDLLFDCNEAAMVSLKAGVFEYTTRMLNALCRLPFVVPLTMELFGEVVDALYFALYEGAGSDHLRYMQPSGPLTKDECEFVFCVKHLRNKWLRHDPEHGSQRSIERSFADLKNALAFFGLDHVPTKPREFRILHEAMIDKAEAFLGILLRKLQQN